MRSYYFPTSKCVHIEIDIQVLRRKYIFIFVRRISFVNVRDIYLHVRLLKRNYICLHKRYATYNIFSF